jgi:hypothetical protein
MQLPSDSGALFEAVPRDIQPGCRGGRAADEAKNGTQKMNGAHVTEYA